MKKRILSSLILVVFVCSFVCFDLLKVKDSFAEALALPSPSTMVELSKAKDLLTLKGININPDNLLDVSFYFDGKSKDMNKDAQLLIEYFLTALTFDGNDLWVNLSPYEKDRVLNEKLASTQLGKVLLKQDYILKQLSSSLTNPNTKLGNKYWKEVDNSFNKIWIAPNKAEVAEDASLALIKDASLKVLTEADYLAMQKNSLNESSTKNILKNKILPLIEKDVNTGENFAELRQVYSALILGFWFKQKYFHTLYSHYIDSAKVKGVDTSDPALKQKVFELYAESFQKGVYSTTVKAKNSNGTLEKKNYFSGGIEANPKVKSSALNKTDFNGLNASSALGFLKPVFKSAMIVKTLFVASLILLSPIVDAQAQLFAQSQASISTVRRARASQELDSLMDIAADESKTEQERIDALEQMALDSNLDTTYLESFHELFYREGTSATIKDYIFRAVNEINDIKVLFFFEDYFSLYTIEDINNLPAEELALYRNAISSHGLWVSMMRNANSWFDKENVGSFYLDILNIEKINDIYVRYDAWIGVQGVFDSGDQSYIDSLEYLSSIENPALSDQMELTLNTIKDRTPVDLYKDFIFYHEDSVANMEVQTVQDTLLHVATNEMDEYFVHRQIEALDYLGLGRYQNHMVGDSANFDEQAYDALDQLESTLPDQLQARVPRHAESVEQSLIEAVRRNKELIYNRIHGVSVLVTDNPVALRRNIPTTFRAGTINLQLDQDYTVRVYNVSGQLLVERSFMQGQTVTNRSLGLDNFSRQIFLFRVVPNLPFSANLPARSTQSNASLDISALARARRKESPRDSIYDVIAEEVIAQYHNHRRPELRDPELRKLESRNEQLAFLEYLKGNYADRIDYADVHFAFKHCIRNGSFNNVLVELREAGTSPQALSQSLEKQHLKYQELRLAHKSNRQLANNYARNVSYSGRNSHVSSALSEMTDQVVEQLQAELKDNYFKYNEDYELKKLDSEYEQAAFLDYLKGKYKDNEEFDDVIGHLEFSLAQKKGIKEFFVELTDFKAASSSVKNVEKKIHGGIDMNLSVSSSALKDKLYSNMSQEQIREHRAKSELLAGFTFELKMQKGKLGIDEILAQKK